MKSNHEAPCAVCRNPTCTVLEYVQQLISVNLLSLEYAGQSKIRYSRSLDAFKTINGYSKLITSNFFVGV